MAGITSTLKKNRNLLVVGLILVIALIGLRIIPLSITGFTVLALQNGILNSNDSYFHTQTFQMTAAASGSQYAQATLSPQDALSQFGVLTSQPAIITAENTVNQCRIQLSNVSNAVYAYSVTGTRATSAQTGYCICSQANTNPGSGYIGTTPLVCPSGYAYNGGCRLTNDARCPTGVSGCQQVYKVQIGTMNKADPSGVFYDLALRINETLGNTTYSGTMTWNNQSIYTPAFRAQLVTAGLGPQACPSATDSDVAVFVNATPSTSPLKYVSQAAVNQVINSGNSIVDVNTAVQNANSYNLLVASMLGSSPNVGQYASFSTTPATTATSASAKIQTSAMTSVPIFTLYLNAETIGIHIPSGQPKIQSVSAGPVTAATLSSVVMNVTNLGESDTFDGSVTCGSNSPQPFPARVNIAQNETKTVNVPIASAGFITQCTAEIHSVGSPQKSDSATVRLVFDPFCGVNAPNPAAQIVFTKFGCAFICPNYGVNNVDVFDASCGVISNYSRCLDANCSQQASYNGYHCIAPGKAMDINQYMDNVNDGSMQPYVPPVLPHQFFITSYNGKMVCQYEDEYGYSNGQPLDSLTFDYALGYPQAQIQTSPVQQNGTQVPTQPPAGTPVPPSQQQPPQQQGFDLAGWAMQNWIIIAAVVFILGGGYWYTKRRK